MGLHPWWSGFGRSINAADDLIPEASRGLLAALATRPLPGVTLGEFRQDEEAGYAAIHLDIEVERPQDLAHSIKAVEPVVILFPFESGRPPSVFALREDFPDTPHQNWTPDGAPCSLCIDDRPWAEARLTTTPMHLIRRVQLWLAKAARGELHDPAQPVDPVFFASHLTLIVPPAALAQTAEPVELLGFFRPDNPELLLTSPAPENGKDQPAFVVLAFRAQPQTMNRLRHAPITLAALADEAQRCGISLLDELRARLRDWAGMDEVNVRRLSARIAVIIDFPVTENRAGSTDDLRGFITHHTAGEVGVALGVLHKNTSQVGAARAYLAAIGPDTSARGEQIRVEPAQVHLDFHRGLAAAIAGRSEADCRRTVLVGAGALGSQLAVNLARDGAFAWTVVDKDYLLPHNLGRHVLFADEVGSPKATALARKLSALLKEPVTAIPCNVLDPQGEDAKELAARLAAAEIIIDASASVAVSRHLADRPNVAARRITTFFNPSGTAVVLLAESADRSITLRDLEAQYHSLVLTEPLLDTHLRVEQKGLRYSGSCRSLTNRIPATRAALLSALAAGGVVETLKSEDAVIQIWNLGEDGQVSVVRRVGIHVHRMTLGSWIVTYDDGLMEALGRIREARLPNETGGVLLGIVDITRHAIHVAHALPQPEDSLGSVDGFERGVVGLLPSVNQVLERSMHQLRYIGEWHSHPRRSPAWPSGIDLAQLAWLGTELDNEGLPALMAIAADDGKFALLLAGRQTGDSEQPPNVATFRKEP
jgi:hypothetical protein